jgi:hypothetical protein
MAEANAKLARNPATVPFREYPTVPGTDLPNEKGLQWVELKQPEVSGKLVQGGERADPRFDIPQEIQDRFQERAYNEATRRGIDDESDEMMEFVEERVRDLADDWSAKNPRMLDQSHKALEDALKYEGSTMGHCVGGYCDDVISGKSRIYSLRDAKGEPHVTIETRPSEYAPHMPDDLYHKASKEASLAMGKANNRSAYSKSFGEYIRDTQTYKDWWATNPKNPDKIHQIKGKQNRKPNDEYLPFVQDFVRSQKWSDVGDIGNAGMMPLNSLYNTHPTKLGLPVELYDPAKINPYDLAELLPEWFSKEDLIQAAKTLLQR